MVGFLGLKELGVLQLQLSQSGFSEPVVKVATIFTVIIVMHDGRYLQQLR